MKHLITLSICLLITALSVNAQTVVIDSASLGAGFVNDVYYRIPTYTKYSTPSDWDIALSVQPTNPPSETVMSTTIRVNGGRGVQMFKITSADVTGFNNVFSSADSASWKPLTDSPVIWDFGGSYSTANASDPFDYGWGDYDLGTHDVVGDSIYAIRTLSGTWKKLMVNKLAYDTAWFLTVADLDNNNLQTPVIQKQAAPGKNFIYMNLSSASVMDKEPAEWDMLFTRYIDIVPGPNGLQPYPVNGVLINKGVTAVKAYPVDVDNVSYTGFSSSMSPNINTIGYDWKTYVAPNFVIADSTVYFVKAQDDNVYRVRFLSYRSSDVQSVFEISTAINTSIVATSKENGLVVYPNPSSETLTLTDFNASSGTEYRIVNATGQVLRQEFSAGNAQHLIDVSGMSNGIYFIQILKAGSVQTKSFVVNR